MVMAVFCSFVNDVIENASKVLADKHKVIFLPDIHPRLFVDKPNLGCSL